MNKTCCEDKKQIIFKVWFYLFLFLVILSHILIYIAEPAITYEWVFINLIISFLPSLFFTFKLSAGERIKFAVIILVTIAAAWSMSFYLSTYAVSAHPTTQSVSKLKELYRPHMRFHISCYVLLGSLYTGLLGSKLSDRIKKLITSVYLTILAVPLLIYFSFDLKKMIDSYYSSILLTGSSAEFFHTPEIRNALIGMGIRAVVFFFCASAIQLPLPALKFRKINQGVYLLGLTALLWIFNTSENTDLEKLAFSPRKTLFYDVMRYRYNPLADGSYKIKNASLPGLYFLIIGESHDYFPSHNALMRHDSFFKSVHNSPEYIVFKDTKSPMYQVDMGYKGASEHSVCNMLSLSREEVDIWALTSTPDILDVMEMCNYKTLLLHNTGDYMLFNTILDAFFYRVDYSLITDSDSFGGKYKNTGFQIDNEIPRLLTGMYSENILDKKNSFMVIKPIGLHKNNWIVPKSFAQKLPAAERGLLYHDQVLGKIISVLRSFPETRAVIYCSDHAFHHNRDNIFMFVYLSAELQKAQPELKEEIETIASKPFCNSDIDRVLLKIMNISISPEK